MAHSNKFDSHGALTTRALYRLAHGAARNERMRDYDCTRHRVIRQILSAWQALDAAQYRDDMQRARLASAASFYALCDADEIAEHNDIVSGAL
jgi:hypothetical protein